MSHDLQLWAGDRRMAVITHDATADQWQLQYADDWCTDPQAFPLSPVLPLERPAHAHASASLRRFIEHLLPEGTALDVAARYNGLSRSNVFGLIRALGAETAGALRFEANGAPTLAAAPPRELPLQELDARIGQRAELPLNVWDGRVRMSVAGLQDKLLVYLDRPLSEGGRLWLVDGQPLASTHLLKPDADHPRTPHLAINEHFCMSLAHRMGLPVAEVDLLRTPRPVLVVRRFDRLLEVTPTGPQVKRLHVIDACQACDLPVSFKYERHLGSAPELQNFRDGMSLPRLFGCVNGATKKAATRLTLLRWALFQLLIGNSDAHGKNFSFFVGPGGLLAPAPWYDLVSVRQYPQLDTELAMAIGDVFAPTEVAAFPLADFARRCGIDRKLMQREGRRLAKAALGAAAAQAAWAGYQDAERPFIESLAGFVQQQAQWLERVTAEAAAVPAKYL